MSLELETSPDLAVDLAREGLYRFFAAALSNPMKSGWSSILEPQGRSLVLDAVELLRAEAGSMPLGFGELPAADLRLDAFYAGLADLPEGLPAEFDRVFGLIPPRECPPHETEFCPNAEPFFRAQQLADIAGFYRAFGLEPSRQDPDRPDHLVMELEFMAVLLMKKRLALAGEHPERTDQAEVCQEAQRSFFRDHLAWWVPSYTVGLKRRSGQGPFTQLAQALAAFLPLERQRLGIEAPPLPVQPTPTTEEDAQAGCAGCAAKG